MRPRLASIFATLLLALTAIAPAVSAEPGWRDDRDDRRGERHGRWHDRDRDHDWRGGRDHDWRGGRDHWRERDLHRLPRHDDGRWRDGRWRHGWHDGRLGWWWIVGGVWYGYPEPIYPYPDPYRSPRVVLAPRPVAVPVYYYCRDPAGYYPDVIACRTPWSAVPAR